MKKTDSTTLFARFEEEDLSLLTSSRKKELRELADSFNSLLSHPVSVSVAKYMMYNKLQEVPLCEVCKLNPVPFRGSTLGFQRTCSIKCSRQLESFKQCLSDPVLIQKRKAGLKLKLDSLGVTNVGQLQLVKDKIKNTVQSRYGVNSVLQVPSVLSLIKQSNLEKYGNENVLSSGSSVRKKINNRLEIKRGLAVEKRNAVKNNRQNEIIATYGEPLKEFEVTNIKRYGSKNVFSNVTIKNKIKQTNLKKYGSAFPTKNRDIAEKISKTKIENFKTDYLPAKLRALAEVGITPSGWTIAEYQGGIHNFTHTICGTTFPNKFYSGDLPKCPKCSANRSMAEMIVASWLEKVDIPIKINDRSIIAPLEIDILTDKLAIEINGVYWHSDDKCRTPLLSKTQQCQDRNLQLLHFWDIEIAEKTEIVKSLILAKHKIFTKKFGARDLKLNIVPQHEAYQFFTENHLQGQARASITLGLYSDNILISAMSFGSPRWSKVADFEIIRYATLNNILVVGGASKLFKHFIKTHPTKSILSFADRRISTGELYGRLGFTFIEYTKPNYFWYKNDKTLSRYQTQKHLLPDILGEKFDISLSEGENMLLNGWIRCSDSGNSKWVYTPPVTSITP